MKQNDENLNIIRDLIREVEDNRSTLYQTYVSAIATKYGLVPTTLGDMIRFKSIDIEQIPTSVGMYNDAMNFLTNHLNHHEAGISTITHNQIRDPESGAARTYEIMTDVKSLSMDILKFDVQLKELYENSEKIMEDYYDFLHSDKVINARKERHDLMVKAVEKETDPEKKAKMLKTLSAIEDSMNLSFLFYRLDDPELQKIEISTIASAFFSERLGEFVMKKFKSKAPKFNISEDAYKYFLNMEEKFLPESYHMFNNLFLFVAIRTVSFADPYDNMDKLRIAHLFQNISKLSYNRFEDETEEGLAAKNTFIEVIMKVDDRFRNLQDEFIEKNTTAPTHPVRQKANERKYGARRRALIEKLESLGIEYDVTNNNDDLYELLNTKVAEMTAESVKEMNGEDITVVEHDGVVTVAPNMAAPKDEELVEAENSVGDEPLDTGDMGDPGNDPVDVMDEPTEEIPETQAEDALPVYTENPVNKIKGTDDYTEEESGNTLPVHEHQAISTNDYTDHDYKIGIVGGGSNIHSQFKAALKMAGCATSYMDEKPDDGGYDE